MATSHDFIISGDPEAGKKLIHDTLVNQGFTVEQTPKGGVLAKRGSMGMTLLLGALAGNNFQMTFIVEYFAGQNGELVARLNRNMGSGALKGGALGAAKMNTGFEETANALNSALSSAGILASSVSN